MEAVVFDCDGVLVDSEPIALEIWSDMLSSYGTPFTEDEVTALVGVSDADAHGRFAGRAGMPPAERFLADFAAERDARFRSSLRAFDDALATVRRLAGDGISMAVASNAPRASLDLALEVTGIGRYLPVAVSSDDVAAPKPAPHVYLEAAARLGVRAERCLAIEDSAAGATAARAAGMRVVTVARHAAPIPGYAFVPALDPDTISIWLGRS